MQYYPKPSQRPTRFTLNPQSPLARGLVFAALGQHTGATLYSDSSVYSADGTLTGFTGAGNLPRDRWGWSDYLKRPTLGFNGSSDYVSINTGYVTPTSSGTAMGFLYWNSLSGSQSPFAHTTDASHVFQMCTLFSGTFYAGWYNGAESRISASGATLGISAGSWYHIALTWSTSLATELLFVNGVQKASHSGFSTFNAASFSALVGKAALTSEYMNGMISDLVVLNRDLSQSEILDVSRFSNYDLRIGSAPPLLLSVRRYWGTGLNIDTGAALRRRYIASGSN